MGRQDPEGVGMLRAKAMQQAEANPKCCDAMSSSSFIDGLAPTRAWGKGRNECSVKKANASGTCVFAAASLGDQESIPPAEGLGP